MSTTTISIVTPSFNQARYISRMLETVSTQSVPPYEHLILDARSTDDTIDFLDRYCLRYSFAKVEIDEDSGPVDAINRGLSRVTGDILCWLNTDDGYSDAGTLEVVRATFEKNPDVDVIYGKGTYVDSDRRYLRDAFVQDRADDLDNTFVHSIGILQPALFFRRKVVDQIGFLDPSFSCAFDYEYWIRMAKGGFKFMFIDRSLAYATYHAESITGTKRSKQLKHCVGIVKKHYGFASNQWIERLVACQDFYFDGMFNREMRPTEKNGSRFQNRVNLLFRYYNRSDSTIRNILSDDREGVLETKRRMRTSGLFIPKKIVVTTFDRNYFDQGVTLVAGIHRNCKVELPIFVYDLGLTTAQRSILNQMHQVYVLKYPLKTRDFFSDYMGLKNYSYKCAAMNDIKRHLKKGDLVLWIDAGVVPLQSLDSIFDILDDAEIFFVDHDSSRTWPFYNIVFTHPVALKHLSANNEEMLAEHLCSCLMGYKVGSQFDPLFTDAYFYSQNPDIICWNKHLSGDDAIALSRGRFIPKPDRIASLKNSLDPKAMNLEVLAPQFLYWGHRQDQSIYSILAARYGVELHSSRRFCYSTELSSRASKLNWQSGGVSREIKPSSEIPAQIDSRVITYHHRGTYANYDGLRFGCRTSDTLMVLGNGPSLKDLDFFRLKHYDTIGMNAAYRYWQKIGWFPRYYICLDEVVGLSHKDAISDLISRSDENGIQYFILRQNLFERFAPLIKESPRILIFDQLQDRFSILSGSLITTGSHAALMGAVFGYRRIVLLGIDCNYVEKIPEARRMGEHQLEVTVTPKNNPNYFFDDYQREGDRYHVPNAVPDLHLESWRLVEKRLSNAKIAVLNVNDKSNVDMFPFYDIQQVVSERVAVGPYAREEHADFDGCRFVSEFLGDLPKNSIMVDVGAHFGFMLAPFLDRKWQVFAFEPNMTCHEHLEKKYGSDPLLTIDTRAISDISRKRADFYTSEESSGISSLLPFTERHVKTASVSVATLREIVEQYHLQEIDFLKIGTEGYDLPALKGLPWDQIKPRLVVCDFDDRKTSLLGYAFAQLAEFLGSKGYSVWVSEWYPVNGVKHDWRRLLPYPCRLEDPNAWGNLIAFREPPDFSMVEAIAKECLTTQGVVVDREDNLDDEPQEFGKMKESKKVGNDTSSDDRTPIPTSGRVKQAPKAGCWKSAGSKTLLALHKLIKTAFTPAVLFSGLALIGAGIVDATRSAWFAGPGLALVGLVIMVEAVVWRRRNRKLRAATRAERERSGQALARAMEAERERSGQALARAMEAERERSGQALARAVEAERERSGQALARAVEAERERSGQALARAVEAERERSGQALARAVEAERERSGQALARAVEAERERSGRALARAVEAERERSGRALATERSRRSLVDAHLSDRGLPLRRVLLLFTIHRSGSTWLFDLLRTHPAVRLEPTARVWTELEIAGWRYPGAFHHAEGASVPLEIAPGFGAAIPGFRRADLPGIDDADRWALEKAHPEFTGFSANGLAARIRNLRERGVTVEVVCCVRNPIDSMWSMAEYKTRNPTWYSKLSVEEIPRHISKSIEVLAELRDLSGGSVIEYENLPDGMAMHRLGRMLAPSWSDAEARAWLSHAASVTERASRRQVPNAGFLGERDRARSPDGPDGVWAARGADVEAANAVHQRLVADK